MAGQGTFLTVGLVEVGLKPPTFQVGFQLGLGAETGVSSMNWRVLGFVGKNRGRITKRLA